MCFGGNFLKLVSVLINKHINKFNNKQIMNKFKVVQFVQIFKVTITIV